MGAIAQELVKAVRGNGGRVFYRQDVVQVNPQKDRTFEVQTRRGEHFQANQVIFNLPASNIRTLLGEAAPRYLRDLDRPPEDGWGAFVVYLGIEAPGLPTGYPLHHQVVVREPLGEGNSLFLSLSPAWDSSRAPAGHRALTLSTHTALPRWWQLHQENPGAYAALKEEYTARLLAAAEIALPGLQSMVRLALPGTPVTFHRFTRRQRGWVGGYPQTSLARTQGPVLQGGLWMVGDSIFPGQSVPAVALGGLRIAGMILDSLEVKNKKFFPNAMASAFTKKAVG
jgi:phytoene dehydrogenase-like protein